MMVQDVTRTPVVVGAGDGEKLRFWGGGLVTVKVGSQESGSGLFLFEDLVARGKTTPLHVHEGEDELLYVLSGEILVHIDGDDHRVGEGGLAYAPRGVAHAFLVTSPTARLLTLLTPGTAEPFYRDASEPAEDLAADAGPVDFDRVREAAQRSGGMRVLGPPPFEPEAEHP